jgi:hypothetical protein
MPEFTVGCLTVVETGPTTTHLGLNQVDLSAGVDVSGNDSGTFYEEFQSIMSVSPVATGTTKAITELGSMAGLNGQCVGSGKAITQVDVISRKLETCQTALGGTPHTRDRVTTGFLRLNTLSAPRGQDATMSFTLDALTDGTNAPLARTHGVALPSPITTERLTLGQCLIAGVVWPEIESVSIDFNVNTSEKMPALGAIWPESIGVLTVRPVITVTGRDLSKLTQALLDFSSGSSATHANTIIQLIRRASGAAYAAFAGSVHTSITAAGIIIPENLVSASANQKATNSIRIPCHYDGTNAPILFNFATAYDTTP